VITLRRFERAEHGAWLVAFLCGEAWPFHVGTADEALVRQRLADGVYDGDDTASFLLDTEELGAVGFARIDDLDDDSVELDLRLAATYRGRGFGTAALRELSRFVFTDTQATRFEGNTRDDNVAMRRAFVTAGFVKEAHHRAAWPARDGSLHATTVYALLRSDWAEGTTTPVPWHDRPDIDGP
jgi:RimJ/RimL family protein N-acetyltransferase